MDAKFGLYCASNFMPEYKFLGYQGLPNSFNSYLKSPDFSRIIWTSHMKTNLGETFFPQVHFYTEKPYKNLKKQQFSSSCKNSLAGRIDPKFCI